MVSFIIILWIVGMAVLLLLQRRALVLSSAPWLQSPAIAHRGLHSDEVPENSMMAFKAAVKKGMAIELDVRLSKDGQVVVFHDIVLKRMTGDAGRVDQNEWGHLKALRLKETSQEIPLLQDVLIAVNGQVPLYIEIKNDKKPGRLERAVLKMLQSYEGPYIILSFNARVLAWVQDRYPNVLRAQNFSFSREGAPWTKILQQICLALWAQPHVIVYDALRGPSWLVQLLKVCFVMVAYHVHSVKTHKKVKPLVDNVIVEGSAVRS
jgi:glycerophosphoryl diester phosphodiesterase